MTAIKRHGTLWGTVLTAGRLLKCHPFHPGGYDPVPEKADNSKFQISNSKFERIIFLESGMWNMESKPEE